MKICIDAGHNDSGYDTGATANGLREQDVNFRVATFLKERLESAGISVILTRERKEQNLGTSVSSSLSRRAEISNREACDYFISLHCNAGGGTGCEVLVLKKGAKAEQLATRMLEKITSRLSLRNRGVKEANLAVLRDTNCPAVLVELAFIDHDRDAALLQSSPKIFADAIAEATLDFLGISPSNDISSIKSFLAEKWGLSNPKDVFRLLDEHPYRQTLYEKIYDSY